MKCVLADKYDVQANKDTILQSRQSWKPADFRCTTSSASLFEWPLCPLHNPPGALCLLCP